jgi:hypothetical protein
MAHQIVCNSKWGMQPKHTHPSAELVRACYEAKRDVQAGIAVWPCSWLAQEGFTEDGVPVIVECGLPTRFTDDKGSYACIGGHDHVPAEVRFEQGWDYAEDDDEARRLAQAGTRPVQVNGDSWIWS